MRGPGRLSHRFSRRSLLRGLGAGSVLLAPFVRQHASMSQAQTPAPPGNLIIFYTPNGHKRRLVTADENILCFGAAATAGGGMTLGKSLLPLVPFQDSVAVIKGLNLKTPTFITDHQDICRILTCWGAPIEGNDTSQFTAFGPSIDQVAGSALGQKPLVVAVDPFREAPHWRTRLSWSASGVDEPFTKDHQAVFTDLFSGLARKRARDAAILDFAKSDVAKFRPRVNRDDLAHLDTYVSALDSLQQRAVLTPMLSQTCAPNTLPGRIAALPTPAAVQHDDKSANGLAAEFQARGELWMDMIAMAFACGTQRVGVIQWGGASEGYNPPDDMGSPNHHSVCNGAAPPDHWAAIDTWYASRFAYQLSALQKLGILDRTIVVWVTEIAEGANQLDLEIVVGGGKALGLKLGQYIQYPFTGQSSVQGSGSIAVAKDPANRSLADLWVTIQQALGVNKATFGDPQWCAGPLTELRG
jgi:hypothetical protein